MGKPSIQVLAGSCVLAVPAPLSRVYSAWLLCCDMGLSASCWNLSLRTGRLPAGCPSEGDRRESVLFP